MMNRRKDDDFESVSSNNSKNMPGTSSEEKTDKISKEINFDKQVKAKMNEEKLGEH